MKKLILCLLFLCVSSGCSKPCFKDEVNIDRLTQCANKDDVRAQYKLGLKYEQGDGVSQDDKKSFEWYSKAADQNDANAQYNLGLKCEQGKGVIKDDKKALEWYSKAATQGHVVAQYKLGDMYRLGAKDILNDEQKSFDWYSKAADQNFSPAQRMLGDMYRLGGKIIIKNDGIAFDWYLKSAEHGDAVAQYNLGVIYNKNKNAPTHNAQQDLLLAVMWLHLSASQNNAEAIKLRDTLIKKMTPSQIQESKKMASDWLVKHYNIGRVILYDEKQK